jgi:hypothetical protein
MRFVSSCQPLSPRVAAPQFRDGGSRQIETHLACQTAWGPRGSSGQKKSPAEAGVTLIIEVAGTGERDPKKLCNHALKVFAN